MRQITVDFPISSLPDEIMPKELRTQYSSMRFWRLDLLGFLYTCVVPEEMALVLVSHIRKREWRTGGKGTTISYEGSGIIRISGEWIKGDQKDPAHRRFFSQLKDLANTQTFVLHSPQVVGDSIRITVVGNARSLQRVRTILDHIGIIYIVKEMTGFKGKAELPLTSMTSRQVKVLRLAHSLGYYSVPRKVTTKQVANLLGMNEGTVGRHIRRAEKHVMDWFVTI